MVGWRMGGLCDNEVSVDTLAAHAEFESLD